LVQARSWAAEIDAEIVTRAGIARREGLSRARVTQLLGLLELGAADIRALEAGVITTNEALRRARARRTEPSAP
jgi:ParB-like chromosome segregation protein Spo0J